MPLIEKEIYKRQHISTNKRSTPPAGKAYRGISTVNPNKKGFNIYDIALIKQDLINHFHIKKGEKLNNPEFGTILWDVLFEPMTDDVKTAIIEDVTAIVNYDPRTQATRIVVDTYESGIQIECEIVFVPYNISETIRLKFDQANGLTA